MIAVRRLTLEVEGERVVIAPLTIAELQGYPARASWEVQLEYFCRFVEEPADFGERDVLFVVGAIKAWHEHMTGLLARVEGLTDDLPLNRAQRRRMH